MRPRVEPCVLSVSVTGRCASFLRSRKSLKSESVEGTNTVRKINKYEEFT